MSTNLCECGCGTETSTGKRFVVGHNCRCEDLTGKIFGKLIVIGVSDKPKKRWSRYWLCRCDCGKEYPVLSQRLKNGRSKGCRLCNNYKKRPYESLYNRLCSQAFAHNKNVNLTYNDYLLLTDTKECHYCGKLVVWKEYNNSGYGHNIDRKDNNIGYVKENCVVCCPRCNWAKQDQFTYDEWLQIGKLIKSWQK
jgi:hypothetical protein